MVRSLQQFNVLHLLLVYSGILAAVVVLAGPAIAAGDDVQAAAAAEGLSCNNCPDVVEPVCGLMPLNGLSVTLSHRCFAICQGLTDIRPGNCEDSFNAALLANDDAAAAAASSAAGGNTPRRRAPMLVPRRRFQTPSATHKCQPSLKDITKYAADGAVFVGCAAVSDKPGPEPKGEASAATSAVPEPPVTTAASAIASAAPEDVVVVTGHILESKARYLYIRAQQMTAGEVVSAASAVGNGLPHITGTMKAPAPEVWDKAQTKRITRSPRQRLTTGTNAGLANQTDAVIAKAVTFEDEPMASAADLAAGGNRKLLQMGDNRYRITGTTNWPWPAMTLIWYNKNAGGFGCSGTIISPGDVLTAGHCVIDSETGETYRDFTVIPGSDGSSEPYGRFGWSQIVWWSFWVGAPYSVNQGIAAGSIYADMALINLNRPTTWWGSMGYDCSYRSYNIRSCGYPSERGWLPHCADGTSSYNNFCDDVRDHLSSDNAKMSGGQSGGPVFNRDTGRVIAVNSGINPRTSLYAPLDNFNWQLLFEPSWRTTIWSISIAFRASYGPIRSQMNNKCLDAPRWDSGTRYHMWDCHGGENQQWMRPSSGDYRLRVGSGRNKCLDVWGASKDNGAAVHVWDCHDGDNQKWLTDRQGRLRPWHAPNKCLDIAGANGGNGAQLVIWDCHDGSNQKWYA